MGRTVRELTVSGKTPDEVQQFLDDWFASNKFVVRDWYSDGVPFTVQDQWSFAGIRISPLLGSIVAARFDMGWILFEIVLRREPNGTLFHGEFYVPGWDFIAGEEIDLDTERTGLARLTRWRGRAAMDKLLARLESLSDDQHAAD